MKKTILELVQQLRREILTPGQQHALHIAESV